MDLQGIEPLHFVKGSEWREWLSRNGRTSNGEWVKIFKVGSEKEGLRYDEAIEEALCFGWIESVMKSMDGDHNILRFTPRRKGSVRSGRNLIRSRMLIPGGSMTQLGQMLSKEVKGAGNVTFVYVRDPEGNILELQRWDG